MSIDQAARVEAFQTLDLLHLMSLSLGGIRFAKNLDEL